MKQWKDGFIVGLLLSPSAERYVQDWARGHVLCLMPEIKRLSFLEGIKTVALFDPENVVGEFFASLRTQERPDGWLRIWLEKARESPREVWIAPGEWRWKPK